MPGPRNLIRELARRRVLQTVGGYIAIVWLLAQGFADLFPAFGLPDWLVPAFVIAAVALLPVVAIVSWRYDLTLQGFVRSRHGSVPVAAAYPDMPTIHSEHYNSDIPGFVALTWEDSKGHVNSRQVFSSVVLGRDVNCDIHITDRRVSRRHLEIAGDEGHWIVRDLESVNGTWLDGKRITTRPLPMQGTLRLDRDGPAVHFSIESNDTTVISRADTTQAQR